MRRQWRILLQNHSLEYVPPHLARNCGRSSRAFAVIGGSGIHEQVGDAFWIEARDAARANFSEGKFTEGIVAAVDRLGGALALFFPKTGPGDTNELPDEVSED